MLNFVPYGLKIYQRSIMSRRANLVVLGLRFLYYLHVLHTLTKSCFHIADIITSLVFIIVHAVVNVSFSRTRCWLCVTCAADVFFFVCLFVFFSFPLRPCNLLGCSPTKPSATHSSYYGLAGKIVYSLQISKEASIVSSLKLKSHQRGLRKPNAPSTKQFCQKRFRFDKLSKFF